METEQSLAKAKAEKKFIDESGFSEQQIDSGLNKAVTNQQTVKNVALFTSTRKEKIIMEKK